MICICRVKLCGWKLKSWKFDKSWAYPTIKYYLKYPVLKHEVIQLPICRLTCELQKLCRVYVRGPTKKWKVQKLTTRVSIFLGGNVETSWAEHNTKVCLIESSRKMEHISPRIQGIDFSLNFSLSKEKYP